jgi:hypothetical protein
VRLGIVAFSAERPIMPRSADRRCRSRRVRRPRSPQSIGLVLEGKSESLAFRQLPSLFRECPPIDRPAVVEGIGDISAAQVAKRVAREVAFLEPDNRKVIVCIDRESRAVAAEELAQEVAAALCEALPEVGGISNYPVDVIVADRAFEAWLLADIACLAASGQRPPKKCYEGYMRPKLGGRKQGYHYGDDYGSWSPGLAEASPAHGS